VSRGADILARMSQLAELRRQRGLTQEEVARIVRVSTRTVAAWESGATTSRHRNARALANALGVTLDVLQLTDHGNGAS
jgi:transcriptional regulator with XRE-family HTH domain